MSRAQEAQEGESVLSGVETGDSGTCVAGHGIEQQRVHVWVGGRSEEKEV